MSNYLCESWWTGRTRGLQINPDGTLFLYANLVNRALEELPWPRRQVLCRIHSSLWSTTVDLLEPLGWQIEHELQLDSVHFFARHCGGEPVASVSPSPFGPVIVTPGSTVQIPVSGL